MASTFKTFLNDDIVSTRTLLNEAVPITGSVIHDTYPAIDEEDSNIKQYSHRMFISVFDYPYVSSSANHLFDVTLGYRSGSSWEDVVNDAVYAKKRAIYNQLAQVLVGHDITGSIMRFDQDGDITAGGTKYTEIIALSFARLLVKDEIKKGSFELDFGVGPKATPFDDNIVITDEGAATDYRVNSPVGEYGILKATGGSAYDSTAENRCGLIFYQAGIAILDPSRFLATTEATNGLLMASLTGVGDDYYVYGGVDTFYRMRSASIDDDWGEKFIQRIDKIDFNNTTELNSSIYFCRLGHNDFNYSSNPTYLSGSKIIVKANDKNNAPIAYVTTIGLYNAYNELLAVAKVGNPLKKSSDSEITARIRLDF